MNIQQTLWFVTVHSTLKVFSQHPPAKIIRLDSVGKNSLVNFRSAGSFFLQLGDVFHKVFLEVKDLKSTLLETKIHTVAPARYRPPKKETIVFKTCIFRCYASFGEGNTMIFHRLFPWIVHWAFIFFIDGSLKGSWCFPWLLLDFPMGFSKWFPSNPFQLEQLDLRFHGSTLSVDEKCNPNSLRTEIPGAEGSSYEFRVPLLECRVVDSRWPGWKQPAILSGSVWSCWWILPSKRVLPPKIPKIVINGVK